MSKYNTCNFININIMLSIYALHELIQQYQMLGMIYAIYNIVGKGYIFV